MQEHLVDMKCVCGHGAGAHFNMKKMPCGQCKECSELRFEVPGLELHAMLENWKQRGARDDYAAQLVDLIARTQGKPGTPLWHNK